MDLVEEELGRGASGRGADLHRWLVGGPRHILERSGPVRDLAQRPPRLLGLLLPGTLQRREIRLLEPRQRPFVPGGGIFPTEAPPRRPPRQGKSPKPNL